MAGRAGGRFGKRARDDVAQTAAQARASTLAARHQAAQRQRGSGERTSAR
jgi:hypothetical protein